MAWVRLRDGAEPLTAEALREFCAGKLAHYKIPRYVQVVDEFPMTVTGKVRKVEMREEAVEHARPGRRRRNAGTPEPICVHTAEPGDSCVGPS